MIALVIPFMLIGNGVMQDEEEEGECACPLLRGPRSVYRSLTLLMPINQPSNQIKLSTQNVSLKFVLIHYHRLTNVSIVRLKKGGKRYEVGECFTPT